MNTLRMLEIKRNPKTSVFILDHKKNCWPKHLKQVRRQMVITLDDIIVCICAIARSWPTNCTNSLKETIHIHLFFTICMPYL